MRNRGGSWDAARTPEGGVFAGYALSLRRMTVRASGIPELLKLLPELSHLSLQLPHPGRIDRSIRL
jgi:hypothetical protein